MRLIDGANARIRVVVRVHAEAEWLVVPKWRCLPVVLVVAERMHRRKMIKLQLKIVRHSMDPK